MNENDVKSVSEETEKRRSTWNAVIKHATLSTSNFFYLLLLETKNEYIFYFMVI